MAGSLFLVFCLEIVMTFSLFADMLRRFLGTLIRMNKNGTIVFFLPQLENRLVNLSEVFESCRDEWTLDESMRAEAVLEEFALRMEIQNCQMEYLTSGFVNDEIGMYCSN